MGAGGGLGECVRVKYKECLCEIICIKMLFSPSSYRGLFNSAIRDLNEETSSDGSEIYSDDSGLINNYLGVLHKDFDMGSLRLLMPHSG